MGKQGFEAKEKGINDDGRMTKDEGDVMKICCWLSSKGELVTGRLNVFNVSSI